MKHTLSVLVEDESGVLTRIAGLFARRGFNIESLAVGHLYKLINVLKVQDITNLPSVERELMLLKVNTKNKNRADILEIVNIFRAKVVDLSENFLIIEVTGDPGKMAAMEQLLYKFGIVEIARTGKISLIRESQVDTNYLKIVKQPV